MLALYTYNSGGNPVMPGKHLLPLLLASLFAAATAHAAIDLIAIGSVSGSYEDFAIATTGPLENGVPGNRLGGIGSGLAYAGCNTFIVLPDRGPNAKPYNSAVDDTTSYIPRFQTFNLSLAPSDPGAELPFTLMPFLTATTLLWSRTPLSYGTGAGLGLDSGAPALNTQYTNYFTGRSDNFDPNVPLCHRPPILTMPASILRVFASPETAQACSSLTNTVLTCTSSTALPSSASRLSRYAPSAQSPTRSPMVTQRSAATRLAALPIRAWKALQLLPMARRWSASCKPR